uniref:HYLS1_C domain-containing protein n=1 Tax=Syphacia muris TaxID=451379 RepID=A0A0N5AZH4_9BILA
MVEKLALKFVAAIRPVFCPPPGGLSFRHDPVKMLELYKRAWSNNPPPGEKKRLSLRWKVREFMMQREISSKSYSDLNKPRRINPEWVPRSYL